MNDRAKLLKVTAIIESFTIILCLMFSITISVKDGFIIYPYIFLLIAVIPCINLWKMYIDEKKHNSK